MPSIYPLNETNLENFTVITNPVVAYTSSSVAGATGSIYVYPRHSPIQKDIQPDSSFVDAQFDEGNLAALLQQVQITGRDIRNGVTLSTSGTYYVQCVSGVLAGVAYPDQSDPFLLPVTASLVYPIFNGTHWVSGSTILFSSGTSGLTYASGSFAFSPQELAADYTAILSQYMAACAAQPQAQSLQLVYDPIRFSPPPEFNSNTLRKLIIKDQLNSYYRSAYPNAQWAYTNYNTLNFFTASTVPSDSVIMYPNIPGPVNGFNWNSGTVGGIYTPSGAFSFDFYINPRYQPDEPNGAFHAGTIYHLSSTYALSLISGSMKDQNGRTSGYRLLLQLGHSTDIDPSQAVPGNPPADLVFLSNDNCLLWNHWHHVVVRWGTNALNNGVGTFNVDQVDVGTFTVPSASFALPFIDNVASPEVLCIGNYYTGANDALNLQANFFGVNPATRDGLQILSAVGIETPDSYSFSHPLNAELHDVAIRTCYLSDLDIATSTSVGPVFLDKTFAFYVPPFFVEQSPYRQFVGNHGGILVTPFEEVNGTTITPFSVALSFGIAGHYINLENFGRDFAGNVFPLWYHLTGVALQSTTDLETCNQFLYSQPFVAKRNLTVMPCDDGNFVPSFQLLVSEGLLRAVDDLGLPVLNFITLDNMVSTGTLLFGPGAFDDGTQPADQVNAFANTQIGPTPESPFTPAGPATTNYINTVQSGSDVEAGAPLTVFQRTQDPSSNEIVVFDISNLFYGYRISPTTLTINDPDLVQSSLLASNLTASSGPVGVTLADDGTGNLYRADCLTPQATWNSVGNLYYNEGELLVKSPHLMFFGFNQYALNFRGEQHVHVMKIDAIAPNNQLNSSSNPNYLPVPPTGYPNDPEDTFCYVSNIYFHDSNLNVVMKTSLAQPIAKRPGDRIMFKIKKDF